MKEPYDEGLASHIDREPCAAGREPRGEASVAERAGRVLSHEMGLSEVPTLSYKRKATSLAAGEARRQRTSRGRRPRACAEAFLTEPGRSRARPGKGGSLGRAVKSKDARRR